MHAKNTNATSIADGIVNVDIETCWRKITDNRNMPYFTIAFSDEFQDLDHEIGPGTVIKRTGYFGSERRIFVIVYDKPYRFAWGSDMYSWDDFIELKKNGQNTQIFLRRKFHPSIPTWYNFIFNKIPRKRDDCFDVDRCYGLTRERLDSIIRVCKSIEGEV